MQTKKMAFAGSWYPALEDECRASIQNFLKDQKTIYKKNFIGGIVPHAGWDFSGSIACRVIAALKPDENTIVDTIMLFGAHMHENSKPFILDKGYVETPFGNIEVNDEMVDEICKEIDIHRFSVQNFPNENTLELQYPFIKYFYPEAKIVICGISPSLLATIIGKIVVKKAKKLFQTIRVIGSTDMTHYGPNFGFTSAGTAQEAYDWVKDENDKAAINAMLEMNEEKIIEQGLKNKNMCCPGAAAATATACKQLGATKAIELGYATSFEKSASQNFVGYSGILFS